MAAAQIIKGDNLMLFDNYARSIAYATNHTFTLTADSTEVNSKDHGVYGGVEVNKINWEIQTENLYSEIAYSRLFTKMLNREKITVFFGLKSEPDTGTVVDGDFDYYTPSNGALTGKAYITSLVVNANTSENATFSCTLTGTGKIEPTDAFPTPPEPDEDDTEDEVSAGE